MLNIRDMSVRCGRCMNFQVLVGYRRRDDWNVYVYECDLPSCAPEETRTLVEVPSAIDEFAQRHPECGGSCGCGSAPEPPTT